MQAALDAIEAAAHDGPEGLAGDVATPGGAVSPDLFAAAAGALAADANLNRLLQAFHGLSAGVCATVCRLFCYCCGTNHQPLIERLHCYSAGDQLRMVMLFSLSAAPSLVFQYDRVGCAAEATAETWEAAARNSVGRRRRRRSRATAMTAAVSLDVSTGHVVSGSMLLVCWRLTAGGCITVTSGGAWHRVVVVHASQFCAPPDG